MGIFHNLEQNLYNLNENTRSWISKSILRKENGAGSTQIPWLLAILQSYNHQNIMVLAQKQKYKSEEQVR